MSNEFEPRRLGAQDVDDGTCVQIWDAQRAHPFDEGKVIAYAADPTIIIERPDGTHGHWNASLPWKHISQSALSPPGPPSACMVGPGVAYWHTSGRLVSFFSGQRTLLDGYDDRELVIAAACLQNALDQINDERRRRASPGSVSEGQA